MYNKMGCKPIPEERGARPPLSPLPVPHGFPWGTQARPFAHPPPPPPPQYTRVLINIEMRWRVVKQQGNPKGVKQPLL